MTELILIWDGLNPALEDELMVKSIGISLLLALPTCLSSEQLRDSVRLMRPKWKAVEVGDRETSERHFFFP